MKNDGIYIESTLPGYCWHVDVMRFDSGIEAFAQEGKRTVGPVFVSFEFDLFGGGDGSRRARIKLPAKRMSAKVTADGIAAMIAKLQDDGLAVKAAA
jgi:hypothetical protein